MATTSLVKRGWQWLRRSSSSAAITASSKSNFSFAFLFLPKPRRQAIHAVYAYCRVIDDIVDSDDPV